MTIEGGKKHPITQAAPEKVVFPAKLDLNKDSAEDFSKRFGYHEQEILFVAPNGEKIPTDQKIIWQDTTKYTQFVTTIGKNYTLLPNEYVRELADKASKLADFQPFKMGHFGSTITTKTKLHAFYAKPGDVYVHEFGKAVQGHEHSKEEGDRIKIGVDVINSMDGSTSFGLGLFSFRWACSNGALLGFKSLESIWERHGKKLEQFIPKLSTAMVEMMDRANMILERYNQMAVEKTSKEQLEKLVNSRIPNKLLPEPLQTNKEKKEPNIAAMLKESQWSIYNMLTQQIWHNPKTDLTTKVFHFGELHRVFPVLTVRQVR